MKNNNIFAEYLIAGLKTIFGIVLLIASIVIFGRLLHFNLMLKERISSDGIISFPDQVMIILSTLFVIILIPAFIVSLFFILRFIIRKAGFLIKNIFKAEA